MMSVNRNDKKFKFPKGKIESFVSMGGFIQEATEEQLCDGYPLSLVETVEKYCKVGPGFTHIISAVQEAGKNRRLPLESDYAALFDYEEEDYEEEDYTKRLDCWYLDKTAKYEAERVSKNENRFWVSWPLNRRTRGALSKLTALEERVLYLYLGMEHGHPLMEDDIANLPEFQCETEYILNILNDIWEVFDENHAERYDFEVLSEKYRNIGNNHILSN